MSDPQSDPAQHSEEGQLYRWYSLEELPKTVEYEMETSLFDVSGRFGTEIMTTSLYAFNNQGRFLGVIKERNSN